MKKSLKSTLVLLLCLVMVAGIIPVGILSAEAAESLAWPVPGHYKLSVHYGSDSSGICIYDSNITGAEIVSACDGKVVSKYTCTKQHYGSLSDCNGFGTGLTIKGNDGRWYHYAHMQANSIPSNIKVGSTISISQIIGKVGATGNSTGPHLFFEIDSKSEFTGSVNPEKESYYKILRIGFNANGGSINSEKSDKYKLDNNKVYYVSNNVRYYQIWKYDSVHENGLTNRSTLGIYRDGYTFKGWGVSKNSDKCFDEKDDTLKPSNFSDTIKSKDTTIEMFAQWAPNTLTVNYYSNYATITKNGDGINSNEQYYTKDYKYASEYASGLTNYTSEDNTAYASRIGYTPTGNLNTMPDGTGISIDQDQGFATGQDLAKAFGLDIKTKSETINIYPEWIPNTYTIIFDANGGSVNTPNKTVTYDSNYGELPTPTKVGSQFAGWSTSIDGNTKISADTKVAITDDQILYAQWIEDTHIHSFTAKTVDASCFTQGYTVYSCACGYSYTTDVTDPIFHNYVITDYKDATCAADGYKIYTCSHCGNSYKEIVNAKGHNIVIEKTNVINSACESEGSYTENEKCTVCGLIISTEVIAVPVTGHIDNDNDGFCDKCKKELNHTDKNNDGLCDYCNKELNHIDMNKDGLCDHCKIELNHVDNNNDGLCDYCNKEIDHKDKNNDGKCDHCGKVTDKSLVEKKVLDSVMIYTPDSATVEWKSHVTYKVAAKGVPKGYSMMVYLGKNKWDVKPDKNGNCEFTGDYGLAKTTARVTVRIVKDGEPKSNTSGPLEKDFVMTVKSSFSDKLSATFRYVINFFRRPYVILTY